MKKEAKAKFCLDVGCGEKCQPGFVGLDKRKLPGVEIVHDIERIPWPLDSGKCDVVMLSHVIEHIKPWLVFDVMNEIWRITREGGLLLLSTPYAGGSMWWKDPSHCSPWSEATPFYFCPMDGMPQNKLYPVYRPKPWKIETLAWEVNDAIEVAFRKISEAHSVEEPEAKLENKSTHLSRYKRADKVRVVHK